MTQVGFGRHPVRPRHVTTCTICIGIAENDEVVAVEDFIDLDNILGKSWVCLFITHIVENDFLLSKSKSQPLVI